MSEWRGARWPFALGECLRIAAAFAVAYQAGYEDGYCGGICDEQGGMRAPARDGLPDAQKMADRLGVVLA